MTNKDVWLTTLSVIILQLTRLPEFISGSRKIKIMKISIFFSVLVAAAALVFAFQNNETVEVIFFSWGFSGSLALVLIAALLVGFLIGFILFVPGSISSRFRMKTQKKAIDQLQKKLEEETIKYDSAGLGSEGENRSSM
ncbi:LapA family protein [Candidatus Pacebacteria bacterium]|nr:LapA family protein [Candidatus Paceibacterota bacterium]